MLWLLTTPLPAWVPSEMRLDASPTGIRAHNGAGSAVAAERRAKGRPRAKKLLALLAGCLLLYLDYRRYPSGDPPKVIPSTPSTK